MSQGASTPPKAMLSASPAAGAKTIAGNNQSLAQSLLSPRTQILGENTPQFPSHRTAASGFDSPPRPPIKTNVTRVNVAPVKAAPVNVAPVNVAPVNVALVNAAPVNVAQSSYFAWQSPPAQHHPQSFLKPEASHAQALDPSTTLGMVSANARSLMVNRVAAESGLHPKVLDAMRQIERHRFVDSALASRAYADEALPIGFQQTISQPSVVARMLSLALDAQSQGKTWLEIGTGCGYQCAVMSLCVNWVCSVERVQGLHTMAQAKLAEVGTKNVALLYGDGLQTWTSQYRSSHATALSEHLTFDAIIVAAAGLGTPQVWLDQLTIGGRLVAPIVDTDGQQRLCVVDRRGATDWHTHILESVQFVPLLQGTRAV